MVDKPNDKPIDKPICWCGSSYKDLTNEKTFSLNARKEAGHQLNQVQKGLDPDDWRPFDVVGPGTKEIRINLDDGWFRVMYVAKFEEALYVLHCSVVSQRFSEERELLRLKF
jgi:phage-related protein